MVGAEREDTVDLRARAGREVDGGPGLLRHLDRRRADSARPRVDEDRLPFTEPAKLEHGLVGGAVDLDYGRSLRKAPVLRYRHREPRVDERVLRVATLRDEAEHPVAGRERRDARPRGGDYPRELEPRDVAEAGRHGVGAGALEAVGPVDSRGPDPHQQLARPRLGLGRIHNRQHFRPAVRGDDHLLHFTIPPSATAPSPRPPDTRKAASRTTFRAQSPETGTAAPVRAASTSASMKRWTPSASRPVTRGARRFSRGVDKVRVKRAVSVVGEVHRVRAAP